MKKNFTRFWKWILFIHFFVFPCSIIYAQQEKNISIYILGTKFDDPNDDRNFTALRDYLTKQMKKNIQQSYSPGTPAAISLAYKGSATDLWNHLPASIKQPFKLSSIDAISIILKLKSVSTENNSETKTDTTTNTKNSETKTNEAQPKNAVSPVIPSSSIILPVNLSKPPLMMNGGIDASIPGLWTATYPNGLKVYFEFKKDGMYVFYTGDYSPTNVYNHKCYWRVDGAFMETFCAGATKVDRSRYIKGYDAANKPTLKIDETIFFPADKKISWKYWFSRF